MNKAAFGRIVRFAFIGWLMAFVFIPEVRTPPLRTVTTISILLYGVVYFRKLQRSGLGKMTVKEIHRSRIRSDPLDLLITVLMMAALYLH